MVKLHVCVSVYTMHPFVVMCATIAMEIVIVRIK